MPSFSKLVYHIVFSTHRRGRTISDGNREKLFPYLAGTIRSLEGQWLEAGGVEDHIHLLLQLPPTITVSIAVRDIKSNSSRWMKETYLNRKVFGWQRGFGAFSVSCSQVEKVRLYVQNQVEHHRTKSFREEYIELLERHRIEFDPNKLFEKENFG